jgi:hypothetical protein
MSNERKMTGSWLARSAAAVPQAEVSSHLLDFLLRQRKGLAKFIGMCGFGTTAALSSHICSFAVSPEVDQSESRWLVRV